MFKCKWENEFSEEVGGIGYILKLQTIFMILRVKTYSV
jgi:hypothetical protein